MFDKDKNRIFLIGWSGYIGSNLSLELDSLNLNFIKVGRSESIGKLDLEEPNFDFIKLVKSGDKCIFLSALSSPEECNLNYERAYKVNVTNTCEAISKLLSLDAEVLFASSDVVYGRTEDPVNERSETNPQTSYADMKLEVESLFLDDPNFYVMRLSYVWSLKDKFSKYLFESSETGRKVEIFHPFIRSIISLSDVMDFILVFINSSKALKPLVNLAGPNYMSRKDLVIEYRKYINLDFSISEPPEEFLRHRPDQILMQSIYINDILKRKTTDISISMKQNLIKI